MVTIARPAEFRAKLNALNARFKPKQAKEDWFRILDTIPSDAIKGDEPAYVWVVRKGDAPVLEVGVAKPEAVDAALVAAPKTSKSARVLAVKSKKDGAAIAFGAARGDPKNPIMIALRDGDRLFVVLGPHRAPPRDPADPWAIRSAKLGSKPKRAPLLAKDDPKPPDLWINGEGEEGIDRATGAVWLDPDRLRGKLSLLLDFKTGMLLGDLAGAAQSRMLLPAFDPEPAVELTVHASQTLLASAFESLQLPPATAQLFSGEVSAVLTPKGGAVLALALRPGTSDQVRIAMEHADAPATLAVRKIGDDELLLAAFGGEDPKSALAAIPGTAKPRGDKRAPLWVHASPQRIREALAKYARPAGSTAEAKRAAEAADEASEVLKQMKSAELSVTFPPGEIGATFDLAF